MRLDLDIDLKDRDLPWRPTQVPGIAWMPLSAAGEGERAEEERSGADTTALIRMDPGCGYPAHRHGGVEEVLILAGGYRDGTGEHRAPCYLRYEPGSVHEPIALGDPQRPVGPANPACILFAVARGGIERAE